MEQDADTLTDGEFHRSAVRPNDRVGRYTLIDRVGFGAMGIVFRAHDPELDRHVAIKVLHRDPHHADQAARRLLREARAMARLVHPNVVAVHDVGTHQGHVFVAMEFVPGSDLRAWMRRGHHWRETAQVMLGASRGLAAAHAAGVVHRDFKPDNVMVDRSGRACVTDFGMAAAARDDEQASADDTSPTAEPPRDPALLTRTGAAGGTPAYLAPEQFEGRRGDALSDQFAFCVTFFEALWGERPFAGHNAAELAAHVMAGDVRTPHDYRGVPAALRRLVLRGLSMDRERRWPSMLALAAALETLLADRRARARYVIAGVASTTVIAGAAWLAAREPVSSCDPDPAYKKVWSDQTRREVHAALEKSSPAGASDLIPRLDARLDAWVGAWAVTFREVCSARAQWSPALADRAGSCLDRRLGELDAALDAMSRIDAARSSRVLDLADGLLRPEACGDRSALIAAVEPPADADLTEVASIRGALADLQARRMAAEMEGLDSSIAELLARARSTGYPAVLAEVLLEDGRLHSMAGRSEPAESALEESFYVATQEQHRTVAVQAAIVLVTEVGDALGRLDDGMDWARHARALLGTLPADPVQTAELDWAVSDLHAERNELDQARALLQAALAVYESNELPSKAAMAHAGLGFLLLRGGGLDGAAGQLELARDLAFESLGAHHPVSAGALVGLATVEQRRGNLDAAAVLLQQARTVYENSFGPEHVNVAGCMHNLGTLEEARGNYARALAVLTPALALRERLLGPKHPDVAATLGLLGVVYEELGQLAEARLVNERALPIVIATYGADHPRVADILGNLGTLAMEDGDPRRAIEVLQRALEIRTKSQDAEHTDVAMVLTNLAHARLALGEFEAARLHATRALAIEQGQLGKDHPSTANTRMLLAEIEAASRRR